MKKIEMKYKKGDVVKWISRPEYKGKLFEIYETSICGYGKPQYSLVEYKGNHNIIFGGWIKEEEIEHSQEI